MSGFKKFKKMRFQSDDKYCNIQPSRRNFQRILVIIKTEVNGNSLIAQSRRNPAFPTFKPEDACT